MADGSKTGNTLVITRQGRVVAKLIAVSKDDPASLLGSVQYDDSAEPLAPVEDPWEAESNDNDVRW